MSPCFILGQENMPCIAEVVNRSLKADCTDFNVPSKSLAKNYSPKNFTVGQRTTS